MNEALRMRSWSFVVVLGLVWASTAWTAEGGDESPSGVSSEAIQLPRPAGTVEGFGGEAESVGNTGAASYNIPIEVPRGVNGLQPQLALSYGSTQGSSPFGLGWMLHTGVIERSALRGVPTYTDVDLFSSADGELVATGNGRYRPLIDREQNLYLYDEIADTWTERVANGRVIVYGGGEDSKIKTPSGTYKWLMTSIRDPFGNLISYEYLTDGGEAYLSAIKYAGLYSIEFSYENRPDPRVSYFSTYPITDRWRCTDIRVKAHSLIRHYSLQYSQTATGNLSLLAIVKLFGADDQTQYPDLTFSYAGDGLTGAGKSKSISFASSSTLVPRSLANPRVTMADLNRDSIPDIIETSSNGATVWLGKGDNSYQVPYLLPNIRTELGGKNVKLMDIDGDRQVDLASSGLNPQYSAGDGDGGFSSSVALSGFPHYSLSSPMVRTFDANGDGRMDIVAQEAEEIWTFFNLGEGNWGKPVKFKYSEPGVPFPTFNFSSSKTFFVDINGDGLTDIAYLYDKQVYFYPNRGNGFWDQAQAIAFEENGIPRIMQSAVREKDTFIADINGDGRPDLLVVLPDAILYSYNRGSSFGPTQILANIHTSAMGQRSLRVTVADVNGNGTEDLVWSNDDGDFRSFDFNELERPNILTEVRNGMGKRTILHYLPHTKYSAAARSRNGEGRLPFVVDTVSQIETYSWQTLASDVRYRYFNGYYDGVKNEFRGFGRIEKIRKGDVSIPDRVDISIFETGKLSAEDKKRGLLLSHDVREGALDGPIFASDTHEYGVFDQADGSDGRSSSLVLPIRQMIYERDSLGNSRPQESTFQYTFATFAEGRLLATRSTSQKDELGNLYRTSRETYALGVAEDSAGQVTLWNVGQVTESRLSDAAGNLLRSQRTLFDGNTEPGVIAAGRPTQLDRWDGQSYVAKSRMGWAGDGNIEWTEDAAGHRTTITYDPSVRIFPRNVTNPKGQVSEAVYDWDRGVLTASKDVNGNRTYFYYDIFLRLVKSYGPVKQFTDIDTSKPVARVSYSFGDENGAPSLVHTERLKNEVDGGYLQSTAYFDPLGRGLTTVNEGKPGRFISSGATVFNLAGLVRRHHVPRFTTGLGDYSPDLTKPFTETFYDVLARPIRINRPEHTNSDPVFTMADYRVGETISTDELGHVSKSRYDVFGRIREQEDVQHNITSYGYSTVDELTTMTDAKGAVTTYQMDRLGRLTCKVDPNLGKRSYQYNDLDLLIQKSEFGFEPGVVSCDQANSGQLRLTRFEYTDVLNRLTKVDYSNAQTPNVLYSYDTGPEAVGRLSTVMFGGGAKSFSYDRYGNITRTDATIAGHSFRTEEKYDILGRLTEVVYPEVGGSILRVGYSFDESGALERVFDKKTNTDLLSWTEYNEAGQPTRMRYGNAIKSRVRYEAQKGTFWLQDVLTYSGADVGDSVPVAEACASNSGIQCDSFVHDKLGNITGIANSRVDGVSKLFSYDSLNRLSHAEGPWGVEDYAFDSIGNFTSKSRTGPVGLGKRGGLANRLGTRMFAKLSAELGRGVDPYIYEIQRPQILSQMGAGTFGFDTYGNLNQLSGALTSSGTYAFDAANRLISYQQGGQAWNYEYDESGNRIRKTTTGQEDLFVNRYYEDVSGKKWRYVFAGGTRVATVAESGEVRYLHLDHLGSTAVASDSGGAAVLRREFSPFGEVINESGVAAVDLKYGFTDKYRDSESGLNYFGARYYLPQVGRWASADPLFAEGVAELGNLQAVALWGYVSGNPINAVDPTGLEGMTDIGNTGPGTINGWAEGTFVSGGEGSGSGGGVTDGLGTSSSLGQFADFAASTSPEVGSFTSSSFSVGEFAAFAALGALTVFSEVTGIGYTGSGQAEGVEPLPASSYLVVAGVLAKGASALSRVFGGGEAAGGKAVSNLASAMKGSRDTTSLSIQDKMVMDAAKGGAGRVLPIKLNDRRFVGMEKMQYSETSAAGRTSTVHFVRDPKTGQLMDFKFTQHSNGLK